MPSNNNNNSTGVGGHHHHHHHQQLATFTTSAPCQYHRGNALTIYDLSLMHDGGRVLFQAAPSSSSDSSGGGMISFPHGSITGIVGTNGAGKSSLAQVLASKELDGFPSNEFNIEYLAAADDEDNHHRDDDDDVADSLLQAPRNYIQSRLQSRLDEVKERIDDMELVLESVDSSNSEEVEQISENLSDLYEEEEKLTERMERETDQAMEKVGLQAHCHKSLGNLSCGWRYKCRLIAAVLTHPDALIIDEPSFLDQTSTEWLIDQLSRLAKVDNAIVILISHKEALLETLCDRILHINSANQTLTTYNCSYHKFRTTLESSIQHANKTIHQTQDHMEEADKALKKVQGVLRKREHNLHKATAHGEDLRFIRGKNKEAKQRADKSAASRLQKARNAVEQAQQDAHKAKRERVKPIHITGMPAASNTSLISLQNVGFRYEGETEFCFENVDTSLESNDRVLLFGYNGCGKTTLVRLILGELEEEESSSTITGTIHRSTRNVLYFPQTALHQLIKQHGHQTALEFLNSATTTTTTATSNNDTTNNNNKKELFLTETQARHHLGDLGLNKDLALSRVATLSAGQRVRLWLAKQLLDHPKPSLLILDEVSENVDVDTRQSLIDLLTTFDGAVLVVSHDPDFVDRASFTKTWKLWRYGLEVTYPDG